VRERYFILFEGETHEVAGTLIKLQKMPVSAASTGQKKKETR
jgi:hypothetical protein